jgi:hypothetical protein
MEGMAAAAPVLAAAALAGRDGGGGEDNMGSPQPRTAIPRKAALSEAPAMDAQVRDAAVGEFSRDYARLLDLENVLALHSPALEEKIEACLTHLDEFQAVVDTAAINGDTAQELIPRLAAQTRPLRQSFALIDALDMIVSQVITISCPSPSSRNPLLPVLFRCTPIPFPSLHDSTTQVTRGEQFVVRPPPPFLAFIPLTTPPTFSQYEDSLTQLEELVSHQEQEFSVGHKAVSFFRSRFTQLKEKAVGETPTTGDEAAPPAQQPVDNIVIPDSRALFAHLREDERIVSPT